MKKVEEKVRVYLEYIKLLWVLMIALGGGLVSLFLSGINNVKESLVFSLGVWLLILTLFGILKLTIDIRKFLDNLEEEDRHE